MPSLISLNTLVDSYDIIYHIYQLNLRINIATKPADNLPDDEIIMSIAEDENITARSVDEALELFASRLLRSTSMVAFLES